MLEKRKDESESVQKYQGMLMAAIIGGLLLFIAPIMVVYITGVDLLDEDGDPLLDDDGNPLTAEKALFQLPNESELPPEFSSKVNSVFELVMWVARVVVVLFIVMAVIMLQMPRQTYPPAVQQKPPAQISKPAVPQ